MAKNGSPIALPWYFDFVRPPNFKRLHRRLYVGVGATALRRFGLFNRAAEVSFDNDSTLLMPFNFRQLIDTNLVECSVFEEKHALVEHGIRLDAGFFEQHSTRWFCDVIVSAQRKFKSLGRATKFDRRISIQECFVAAIIEHRLSKFGSHLRSLRSLSLTAPCARISGVTSSCH